MEIKAIIVEDESSSREALYHLLQKFCPEVKVINQAETVKEAVQQINAQTPDLIFLDIELPQENGFKLLQYFPQPSFDIIFTTAYDQYAVQAFRMAAVDYLLKPLDVEQLQEAIGRIGKGVNNQDKEHRLDLLTSSYVNEFQKIALPTIEGYSFIELDQIIFCEASRSYTLFYLKNQEKIMVSKPLKFFEEVLRPYPFFRISRSNIINLQYIKKYSRAHQGEVTLENGKVLSVSEHKRSSFLKRILGK